MRRRAGSDPEIGQKEVDNNAFDDDKYDLVDLFELDNGRNSLKSPLVGLTTKRRISKNSNSSNNNRSSSSRCSTMYIVKCTLLVAVGFIAIVSVFTLSAFIGSALNREGDDDDAFKSGGSGTVRDFASVHGNERMVGNEIGEEGGNGYKASRLSYVSDAMALLRNTTAAAFYHNNNAGGGGGGVGGGIFFGFSHFWGGDSSGSSNSTYDNSLTSEERFSMMDSEQTDFSKAGAKATLTFSLSLSEAEDSSRDIRVVGVFSCHAYVVAHEQLDKMKQQDSNYCWTQ